MKSGNDEHLEIVALRNAELFHTDPEQFKNKMLSYGWQSSEVEKMIKVIERKSRNES